MFPADNKVVLPPDQAWASDILRTEYDVSTALFSIFPVGGDNEFSQLDFANWALYFRTTLWVPLVVSLLYCASLVIGQHVMKSRSAFILKTPLAVWNFALSIFSIIGTIKIIPYFISVLIYNGPTYFLCRFASASYAQGGEVAYWSLAFVLSKYAELIDTLFLVLRKKPVPFLHWYHHATVLLISVHSMAVGGPTGIVMVAMNFFVHSVMYTYYFLAAVMDKPPRWGRLVTSMQIAQMVIGTAMAVSIYVASATVENCYSVPSNNAGIAAIYLSYLFLFLRFYSQRYDAKKGSLKKSV